MSIVGMTNYVNFLKYVPFSGYHDFVECSRHLERGLFTKQIEEHKKRFKSDQEPRDIIDSFLLEMNKKEQETENNKKSTAPTATGFNNEQMLHLVADIFAAGTDTTGKL